VYIVEDKDTVPTYSGSAPAPPASPAAKGGAALPMKSEIRSSKLEANPKLEMIEIQNPKAHGLGPSDFGFRNCFGFRHSDFGFGDSRVAVVNWLAKSRKRRQHGFRLGLEHL
jgi:hypothetical protein